MKGIVLHGGHGTRLRPLTHTGPKQLLPIANKPMSQYCIESLRDGGITDIAIVIGGNGFEKVREYYGDGGEFGISITYVLQDEPKGIAHAIRLCKNFVGSDKFVAYLGDNILIKGIKEYVDEFGGSSADATLLLCEVEDPSRFGIVDLDEDNCISMIMEKPRDPPTNMAVTGIYFLTPRIFEVIDDTTPSDRGELEITDALQNLLQDGGTITYHSVKNYWKDTGTPGDIIHANGVLLGDMDAHFDGSKDASASMEGRVMVGSSTQITGGAKVVGPVMIGKRCKIMNGAVIGPNVSIGDNVSIGRCRIRDSIIMSDCTIDAGILVRDSIVSSGSEITRGKEPGIFLLGEGTKIFL